MNSWPPEDDKYSTMYGSWDMIAQDEWVLDRLSTDTTEQNVAGVKGKNENDLMDKEQFKTGNVKMSTVDSSGLNRNYTEQTVPLEENGSMSYYRIADKKREGHQTHRKTEQSSKSKIYTCDIQSVVADTEVRFPSTTDSYGGTRSKLSAGFQRTRKGNSRKEEIYHPLSTSEVDDANEVEENDIKITFSSDENDELVKNTDTTNKQGHRVHGKQSDKSKVGITGNGKRSYVKISHNNQKPTNESFTYNTLTKDPRIETLGDALKYFNLYSRLQLFEMSLEDVRRHKKGKGAHESDFKLFDKEIQKLSFRFHPDKVKSRGGSEEEIAIAQKLQTALNAIRTVLNVLNEAFLEDINTDHKYGYYTKLNISSLGNEDEVKNRICEVLFKISFISEIKQQKIIAEIRDFLIESKSCVKNFFENNVNEFEKCRNAALYHLKKCIKGYKKLLAEFKSVEEECADEKLDNIKTLIRKMSGESSRNLYILREIKKLAKKSLSGTCHFYSTPELLDDYFVLPFACYINVIVMCNVMLRKGNQTSWGNLFYGQPEPAYNCAITFLIYLYYLASFFSGNKQYKNIVEKTMGPEHLNNEEIKQEFREHLQSLNEYLEDNFKVSDYYIENNRRNNLLEEYKKCMRMMADFKMKEEELKNDIKKFVSRNQEIEDKYDKAMKETEEISNKVQERLEQSKLLREKISASLPNR